MRQLVRPGFTYRIDHVRNGRVIGSEMIHNLMPTEGMNYALSVLLKGTSQTSNWFVGLYEGNYTPVAGDKAATFPTSATEVTTYDEASRVGLTWGSVENAYVDNAAAKSEFTSNEQKTVTGAFITSASGKGATSGVLLSAAKFSSPKPFAVGDVLKIVAGFTLQSI